MRRHSLGVAPRQSARVPSVRMMWRASDQTPGSGAAPGVRSCMRVLTTLSGARAEERGQ
jgi:hypothetical protein